ncbi:MAG: hypothetical protein WDN75_09495 [Bacteroidota bacterium]
MILFILNTVPGALRLTMIPSSRLTIKEIFMRWLALGVNCNEISPVSRYTGSTSFTQRPLSKITYPQGYVQFSSGFGLIGIYRKDNTLIKSFELKYGTMGTGTSSRKKLSKVTEYSSSGQKLPPYEFYYDEKMMLPPKGSYKQDHWGYFNNNNVLSFIPQKIEKGDGSFIVFKGGG